MTEAAKRRRKFLVCSELFKTFLKKRIPRPPTADDDLFCPFVFLCVVPDVSESVNALKNAFRTLTLRAMHAFVRLCAVNNIYLIL